jgi:GT2 family glycosyltransferase
MLTVGVVIVNWNAGAALAECVRSVLAAAQTHFQLSRVVVIDNASDLAPLSDWVVEQPQVTVVRNTTNRGFAAACNQGAEGLATDLVLFLNPDATLQADTLDKAVALLAHPDNAQIAICGVKMVDASGRPAVCGAHFPTAGLLLGEMLGLNRILRGGAAKRLLTSEDLVGSQAIDQVIGAFFLVRRDVFVELNGFDERFFVYFEEVDFSLRTRLSGYTSYYLEDALAFHIGGACSENDLASRLFYSMRSRLLYADKHFKPVPRTLLFIGTLIVEPVTRILGCACRRSWAALESTCEAYHRLFKALLSGTLYGLSR